jgi:thiamine biosynthesis lipoprotein
VLPNPSELEQARQLVGWEKVELDEAKQTVRLTTKGMKLDLGGIAKGYADDEAQKALRKFGITRALVEMGGDLVVSGPPPGTDGWTIRVPNAGGASGPIDMRFANRAISTSGDTEQFVVIGGKQYSHVIDPRTGQALTNRVQVTVIAKDGLTSDPLTKTLCVMPPEESAKVLRHYRGVRTYVRVLKFGEEN